MSEKAVFGGGCFWCLDAIFRQLKGVDRVVAGYAGGTQANPTYESSHNPTNGHAEVIEITFDPSIITYHKLLEIFFTFHNPTTLNRQGNDIGLQYRSIILYNDTQQEKIAKDVMATFAKELWSDPLTTELKKLDKFWPGEDYHQDYFNKNPEQGYCQIIINPKLAKFRTQYADLIKD